MACQTAMLIQYVRFIDSDIVNVNKSKVGIVFYGLHIIKQKARKKKNRESNCSLFSLKNYKFFYLDIGSPSNSKKIWNMPLTSHNI